MKKAQAEVIGIAVMVLMVIALLLITRPSSESKAIEHNEERALASMLSSTFSCNNEQKTVAEFAIQCRENCGCAAVAFDYLLPTMARRYSFEIRQNNMVLLERNTASCPKKSVLLASNQSIEVSLGIC